MQIGTAIDLRQKRLLALTPDMQRAIGILQMTVHELARTLRDAAAENPLLRISEPLRQGPPGRAGHARGFEPDDLPASAGRPAPCLHDHVQRQLGLCGITAAERPLALVLADALLPVGWLDSPLAEIASRSGLPLGRLEQVLAKLQAMEPTGLFARDLAECLRLQLAEAGHLDAAAQAVLAHLRAMETGGPEAVARAAGLSRAAVDAVLQRLRRLDPRPGLAFASPSAPAVVPELIVSRGDDGGWQVHLDRSVLPTVRLDAPLLRQIGPSTPSDDLRDAFGSARWLLAAVARRQDTVLRIGATIVQRQAAFLDAGPEALLPLSQRELAASLDLSESTVSRVVNAVFIQTPRGTFPLKRFFLQPVGGDVSGEGVSPAWLCSRIREQIRAEHPRAPVSDAAIAARFERRGLKVARRTIAKYRASMGIPSTAERRRCSPAV